MLLAVIVSVVLVGLSIVIHYEALRITSAVLPGPQHLGIRGRMILIVFACFAAHTLEVWVYAAGFWILDDELRLGSLTGHAANDLFDFVYFSATTYTSLGFGDLYPIGAARLLAGVEALNGLLLIGWSASFTYLVMEKYWPRHQRIRGSAPASFQEVHPTAPPAGGRDPTDDPA
jgi:hypothetical protein